jgi:hypothetical protein
MVCDSKTYIWDQNSHENSQKGRINTIKSEILESEIE